MTIPHFPVNISFVRRRQSLSCARRESHCEEDASTGTDGCPWNSKDTPLSQLSSGRNRTNVPQLMDSDAKSDTLFTAFPVELRVEVFLQFCGMYCPIGKETEGPLMLLQVCRAWKELVLQTPQLWTSFALDFRSFPPNQHEFLISTMKRWIDRSRNLPLSFNLHYPLPDATCTTLIQYILPLSVRWRDVTLCAPAASLFPQWEVNSNSFPSLRTLSMRAEGPCPFALSMAGLGFNWAQLTELDVILSTLPTLDECLHILKEGVGLKRCSMYAFCVFGSKGRDRITLPKLEHLQLTVYGMDNGAVLPGLPDVQFLAFLVTLSLPGLESLKIGWNVPRGRGRPYYWSDCHAGFVAFLEQLGEHLQALHLQSLPFDARQVLQCLQVVPCLRHLHLSMSQADEEHDFIDNELFGGLTQQPGCSGLLPLLEGIRLESPGKSLSNPDLLRFIASRWRYQKSTPGCLEGVDLVLHKRRAEYRPWRFRDTKEKRLQVNARLKSEFKMVEVLASFLNRDSYGELLCFLNNDFPLDIRSLLIFD
ncbi:hypothetical protein B0H17DRAFT_988719 [Mycena rosella]|uniref:F-box domain-containing protein n=1 Tax=Mycena rosella TaxID=1033263 RepID=A0AAD7GB50_MYCRO|nr:hypothetical protein B0H17DRAFT_988719 [Mycena rosella]